MKLKVVFNVHLGDGHSEVLQLLKAVFAQGEKIMATQAELTAQVKDVTTKLTKIQGETGTLLTKIEELKAIIDTGGSVSAELQTAVDALVAQAAVVDDLVPDAPPPP